MSLQNLFVAKLPRNLTDTDLLEIFAEFHPTSAKVMLDAATGKSKGFGFVLFATEENGGAAYKALNKKSTRSCGHSFSLVIYPSNHDGRSAAESSNALYIRNIPISVPQERVEQFLRAFGDLTFIAMREDHYGSPVWVVYAEYETVEQARNALHKLHGNNSYFHGSAPILAKFEDTDSAKRERRRRREEAQASGGSVHSPPAMSGCVFPPPRDASSMDDIVGSHPGLAPAANTSHPRLPPFSASGSAAGSLPLSYPAQPPSHDTLGQYGFRPVPLSYNPMQANPYFPFGTPVDIYATQTAFSGPTPNMIAMPPPYTGGARESRGGGAHLLQPNPTSSANALLRDNMGPAHSEAMPPGSYTFSVPLPQSSAPPMASMSHGGSLSRPSASHDNVSGSISASAHGSLLSPSMGAYVLQDGGQQFVLSSNVMNVPPSSASVHSSLPVDGNMGSSSSPAAQGSVHGATLLSAGNASNHPIEGFSDKDVDDIFNPYSSAFQRTTAPAPSGSHDESMRYTLLGSQH